MIIIHWLRSHHFFRILALLLFFFAKLEEFHFLLVVWKKKKMLFSTSRDNLLDIKDNSLMFFNSMLIVANILKTDTFKFGWAARLFHYFVEIYLHWWRMLKYFEDIKFCGWINLINFTRTNFSEKPLFKILILKTEAFVQRCSVRKCS